MLEKEPKTTALHTLLHRYISTPHITQDSLAEIKPFFSATSSIQHPASSIQHPASSIQLTVAVDPAAAASPPQHPLARPPSPKGTAR